MKSGHANVTNSILEATPFESNSQADDGRTALFFAARADQRDIAMLLLNAAAVSSTIPKLRPTQHCMVKRYAYQL